MIKHQKPQTIQQFFKQFPNDAVCLEHITLVRYGDEPGCPKCKRQTKLHRVSSQRAYVCQWCGHHTYPCVGTPFESSRTHLTLWFYAIYLFTQTRRGVSAKELQRQLGVTYKCAWRMGHEIRKHMVSIGNKGWLSGDIEIDETYIGSKKEGKRGCEADGKTIVFEMLERAGSVKTEIVPNVATKTLQPLIAGNNIAQGSTIHTDEYRS